MIFHTFVLTARQQNQPLMMMRLYYCCSLAFCIHTHTNKSTDSNSHHFYPDFTYSSDSTSSCPPPTLWSISICGDSQSQSVCLWDYQLIVTEDFVCICLCLCLDTHSLTLSNLSVSLSIYPFTHLTVCHYLSLSQQCLKLFAFNIIAVIGLMSQWMIMKPIFRQLENLKSLGIAFNLLT